MSAFCFTEKCTFLSEYCNSFDFANKKKCSKEQFFLLTSSIKRKFPHVLFVFVNLFRCLLLRPYVSQTFLFVCLNFPWKERWTQHLFGKNFISINLLISLCMCMCVCWCVCVPTTILYLPVTNIQTKATEEKRQKHNQTCSSSIYSLSLCTGISREKKKSI